MWNWVIKEDRVIRRYHPLEMVLTAKLRRRENSRMPRNRRLYSRLREMYQDMRAIYRVSCDHVQISLTSRMSVLD